MALKSIPLNYQTPAAALFALLLGAAWLTAWGWKQGATGAVVERELQRSIAVATSLSNALWPRYLDQLRRAARTPAQAVPRLDFLKALGRDVESQIRGQRLLKVKIYDPRGVVVFSTERKQIGEDQADSPGVQSALEGEARAELVHRAEFSALDAGLVADRDLVQAYVPANPGVEGRQEAVFEVYTDVTPVIAGIDEEMHRIWAIANLAGFVIFALALQILHRAERIQRERDGVTGLPVREVAVAAMAARRSRDLASVQSPPRRGWLVVDVMRLRQVSTAFGHRVSDEVLRQAAARLRTLPAGAHRLFRLPGDGFAYMLKQDRPDEPAAEYAVRMAREVLALFDTALPCGEQAIVADIAIGVALPEGGETDADDLLKRAEAALGEAKARGSRNWALYSAGLESGLAEHLLMKAELRGALERGEFEVYYQPLVDAASHRLLSCEALVRWRHPRRGLVSPTLFVPMLEESGHVIEVGAFVLREACRRAQSWRESFAPGFSVSVNLSTRQFTDPHLKQTIRAALGESGLPPAALILEVTETYLATNPQQAASLLGELKAELGVSIAIDDFGQGYSSLASLRQFPVDMLKIDRAFVINAPNDPVDASIARAVASLAQGLALTLIAEGVETEAQADFTQGIGCHKLQGFLFAKPLPAGEFEAKYGGTVSA